MKAEFTAIIEPAPEGWDCDNGSGPDFSWLGIILNTEIFQKLLWLRDSDMNARIHDSGADNKLNVFDPIVISN